MTRKSILIATVFSMCSVFAVNSVFAEKLGSSHLEGLGRFDTKMEHDTDKYRKSSFVYAKGKAPSLADFQAAMKGKNAGSGEKVSITITGLGRDVTAEELKEFNRQPDRFTVHYLKNGRVKVSLYGDIEGGVDAVRAELERVLGKDASSFTVKAVRTKHEK